MTRVLYLIACAAGPAQHLDQGVRLAQGRGWDVCAVLTPSAAPEVGFGREVTGGVRADQVASAYLGLRG